MAKSKSEQVSVTNTKAEILDAYKELLQKSKATQQADPVVQKQKKERKETLLKVEGLSLESILTGLGGVKLQISQALESIETKMTEKVRGLENLEKSIQIRANELEEIHDIQVEAESLAALRQAHAQFKEDFQIRRSEEEFQFDKDMSEKRESWKMGLAEAAEEKKEREAVEKKQRQREQEEYLYQLNKGRQKEEDDYATRRAELEKELLELRAITESELTSREQLVSKREQAVDELQREVNGFSERIRVAIEGAEEQITQRLSVDYENRMALREKEVEGQIRLQEQSIVSLENKVKEQILRIQQLTTETKEAGKQAQSIAIRAIDGASGRLRASEINRERASSVERED